MIELCAGVPMAGNNDIPVLSFSVAVWTVKNLLNVNCEYKNKAVVL